MSFEKTSRNFGSGVATHDLLASWSGYMGVYYNGGYGRVKIKRNGLDADPYGTYQEVLDRSVYGNTYFNVINVATEFVVHCPYCIMTDDPNEALQGVVCTRTPLHANFHTTEYIATRINYHYGSPNDTMRYHRSVLESSSVLGEVLIGVPEGGFSKESQRMFANIVRIARFWRLFQRSSLWTHGNVHPTGYSIRIGILFRSMLM